MLSSRIRTSPSCQHEACRTNGSGRTGSGRTHARRPSRRRTVHDRRAVGSHRLHGLRRTADAHRHVAPADRRARGMARRDRVRGRHRGDEPPAGPGVDATRHLLRLASPRPAAAHSSVAPASSAPGLVAIIALAAVFLATDPPTWIKGAALGAGAAVAPVALNAALGLDPGQLASGRCGSRRAESAGCSTRSWEAWRPPPSGPFSSWSWSAAALVEALLSGRPRPPATPAESRHGAAWVVAAGGLGRAGLGRAQGRARSPSAAASSSSRSCRPTRCTTTTG